MTPRRRGWLLVGIQGVLLVLLIALPSAGDWPTPPWLLALSFVGSTLGLLLLVWAAIGLGPSLTATPEPRSGAVLQTGGSYRFVRHPIYSAVMLVVVALAARSGNVATAAVAVVTLVFFALKARWEEQRLRERYADYDAYAAATPRFVPRIRR